MQHCCVCAFSTYICNTIAKVRRAVFILFLLGIIPIGYAQIQKGGVVLDRETQQGIPFATLYYVDIGSGALSDSTGSFYMQENCPLN